MKQTIIAAMSANGVIGSGGELPWHLPADLDFFLQQIQGCYLLSGRQSYESEQGQEIFRGRDFVVITRQAGYRAEGGRVCHSIEEGIEAARQSGAKRLCILGGADIYRQTISRVDELIITEINAIVEGDSFFPPIDPDAWREYRREEHLKDAENPFDYAFVWYERRE